MRPISIQSQHVIVFAGVHPSCLVPKGAVLSRTQPDVAGIKAYDREGIKELVADLGLPAFRAKQLEEWIYAKRASSYDEMTNLPKALRERLADDLPLYTATIVEKLKSTDGTRKYVIRYNDGALVEAVGIPSKNRLTVCFSTQAGCPMGCAFCATGKGGFLRNLAPGEIVDQVMLIGDDFGRRVTNAVAMGQGEPFLNYDATLGALRFLNSPAGANIGARHMTISTCGVIPMIRRLALEPEQFTLAVSLHSAVQKTRDKIMPGVSSYGLDRLRDSLVSYSEATGRRPTFEYALMFGVNDSPEERDALVDYCRKMLCHVNLIPLNKVEGSRFKPSDPSRLQEFCDALNAKGIEATIRNSRGSDIQGACGQLLQDYSSKESDTD